MSGVTTCLIRVSFWKGEGARFLSQAAMALLALVFAVVVGAIRSS